MLKTKLYFIRKGQSPLFLILAFSFILINLSSSLSALEDNEVPFLAEQYRPYDIKIPCNINDMACGVSTGCNISVAQPNSSFLVNNVAMSRNNLVSNYTLTGTQLSILGRYQVFTLCNDKTTGINFSDEFILIVTPTGNYENTASNILFYSIAFILSFGLIILGFNRKDAWTAMLGGFLLTLVGIYILINGLGLYHNNITNGMAIVLMSFSVYICLRAGIEVIDENFK